MAYALGVITPATILPVDLATAKAHCRTNTTVEDTLLTAYVASAVATWEGQSGYTPTTTTYELRLDGIFGRILYLPRRPVTSVGSVTYLDVNGAWQTLPGFSVDMGSTPARIIFPTSLPSLHPTQRPCVKVQFTSGHSSAAAVPSPITTAITRLAAHYFKSRDLGDDKSQPLAANWQWTVDQYSIRFCGEVWGERHGCNNYFGRHYGV